MAKEDGSMVSRGTLNGYLGSGMTKVQAVNGGGPGARLYAGTVQCCSNGVARPLCPGSRPAKETLTRPRPPSGQWLRGSQLQLAAGTRLTVVRVAPFV